MCELDIFFDVIFEEEGCLSFCLIDFLVDSGLYLEACFGRGFLGQFFDKRDAGKDGPLPGPG